MRHDANDMFDSDEAPVGYCAADAFGDDFARPWRVYDQNAHFVCENPAVILACTVFGEARNQRDRRAKVAVCWVIRNRSLFGPKGDRGRPLHLVCLRRAQFSCWNPRDRNRPLLVEIIQRHRQGKTAEEIERSNPRLKGYAACDTVVRAFLRKHGGSSPVGRAVAYFNPARVNPKWARAFKQVAQIGDHRFFVQG